MMEVAMSGAVSGFSVPSRPAVPGVLASSSLTPAQARYGILPMPTIAWTPEVEKATASIYDKVKDVIPAVEWPFFAPYIKAINELKAQRGAVILAHNYQTPEIFHGVADVVGDSLQLARLAAKAEADIIVQCGVHFMAETSKLLSPEKTVLIPDSRAGCSLAASITGADVRLLKQRYPGVPVVTYVNSSADVKAETDICCTSSNAVDVVESLGVDRVIFLPDEYLGKYVATQTKVKLILWKGHCEVHERFTGRSCGPIATRIPRSRSSRTLNARRTSSPRRTSRARPRT